MTSVSKPPLRKCSPRITLTVRKININSHTFTASKAIPEQSKRTNKGKGQPEEIRSGNSLCWFALVQGNSVG